MFALNVLVGLLIGAFFPVLFVYAGRLWAVVYGSAFVLGVAALDRGIWVDDRLTYEESSAVLIAFAVTVMVTMRLATRPVRGIHRV